MRSPGLGSPGVEQNLSPLDKMLIWSFESLQSLQLMTKLSMVCEESLPGISPLDKMLIWSFESLQSLQLMTKLSMVCEESLPGISSSNKHKQIVAKT